MTRASSVAIRTALLVGIIGTGMLPTVAPNQVEAADADLSVTATVVDDCVLSTSPVAFGTYVNNQAEPQSATGTITYNCAAGLSIMIDLDDGAHPGTGGERQMANSGATEFLTYDLYQSEGGAVWGEGGEGMSINPTPSGSTPLTVYGEVDASQNVTADDYSDTVGVVLTIL